MLTHPAIVDARARLLEGITKENSTLSGDKILLAATLLQLHHEAHVYRIALSHLTLPQRLSVPDLPKSFQPHRP